MNQYQWPTTVAQMKVLAAELIRAAEIMGGDDEESHEVELVLAVAPAATVQDDDGDWNAKPILTVRLEEYPEEGVYPVDPYDPTGGRIDDPTPPASAQDDAKDERQPLFWYRPRSDDGYEGPIHNDRIEDVRKQSGAWVPLYPGFATLPKPLYDLRYHGEFIRGWNQCLREVSTSVAAPAAGDARDAARYREVRNNAWVAGTEFRIMNPKLGYVAPSADVEFDAFIDAAIAAQRKGDA